MHKIRTKNSAKNRYTKKKKKLTLSGNLTFFKDLLCSLNESKSVFMMFAKMSRILLWTRLDS